jgi:hypothetical protein
MEVHPLINKDILTSFPTSLFEAIPVDAFSIYGTSRRWEVSSPTSTISTFKKQYRLAPLGQIRASTDHSYSLMSRVDHAEEEEIIKESLKTSQIPLDKDKSE